MTASGMALLLAHGSVWRRRLCYDFTADSVQFGPVRFESFQFRPALWFKHLAIQMSKGDYRLSKSDYCQISGEAGCALLTFSRQFTSAV